VVTLRRTTASLESLTEASERVGRGDLSPSLPPPGPDEVGRLSAAFRLMVGQVREMLRRVEETRQMAVMGELASNVSHQIRNPLTSIKLNLQGLEEEAKAEGMSELSTRSLRICLREVANLEEAVRKILDLARTHPPRQVETSLHDVISESLELLQSQLDAKGVRMETALLAAEDRVLADPEEIKNVFVNLLVNAQEAMPEGGTVHVTTENPLETEPDGTVDVGWETTIRVSIRDEGPGVPEEVREQIFRPFVTTKPDGTGFGLAVARLAVQEHRGRIHLESGGGVRSEERGIAPGRSDRGVPAGGATFVVEIPLAGKSLVGEEERESPNASLSEERDAPPASPGAGSRNNGEKTL
jgi:signal transduction histidine kinase